MNINTFNFPDTFSNDGRVSMKKGADAVSQCLGLMVKCQRPQLRGDPQYGTNLYEMRYMGNTKVLRNMVKDDIIRLSRTYDDRIIMEQDDVSIEPNEEKVNVYCQYYLKSQDSKFGFDVVL